MESFPPIPVSVANTLKLLMKTSSEPPAFVKKVNVPVLGTDAGRLMVMVVDGPE